MESKISTIFSPSQKTLDESISDVVNTPEIVDIIFQELSVLDLLHCQGVCKLWRAVQFNPELWRKHASMVKIAIMIGASFELYSANFCNDRQYVLQFWNKKKEFKIINDDLLVSLFKFLTFEAYSVSIGLSNIDKFSVKFKSLIKMGVSKDFPIICLCESLRVFQSYCLELPNQKTLDNFNAIRNINQLLVINIKPQNDFYNRCLENYQFYYNAYHAIDDEELIQNAKKIAKPYSSTPANVNESFFELLQKIYLIDGFPTFKRRVLTALYRRDDKMFDYLIDLKQIEKFFHYLCLGIDADELALNIIEKLDCETNEKITVLGSLYDIYLSKGLISLASKALALMISIKLKISKTNEN